MDLIAQLVQQLGVNNKQAEGGLGALLQLAQQHVSGGTFAEILKLLPQARQLMQGAPQAGGLGGMLGGLMGGKMADFAKLSGQFQSLGMDTGTLSSFARLALGFLEKNLQGNAGAEVKALVDKYLK